jgi:hypothetical protein
MLLLYLLRRRRLHLRPHLRHRLLVTLHLKHGRLPLLLLVLLTVMVGFMLRDRCSPGLREQLSRLPRCAVDVAGAVAVGCPLLIEQLPVLCGHSLAAAHFLECVPRDSSGLFVQGLLHAWNDLCRCVRALKLGWRQCGHRPRLSETGSIGCDVAGLACRRLFRLPSFDFRGSVPVERDSRHQPGCAQVLLRGSELTVGRDY